MEEKYYVSFYHCRTVRHPVSDPFHTADAGGMDHWKMESWLAIVNWAFRWVIRLSGVKVVVKGEENIPKDTAVLYVGNHRSYYDIILTYVRVPRPTGYVAKIEM